ncbi:MAG: sugar ABC transporter ATP-binding protein, partial [Alphaproteobacteria bacterium]|nr:sugar ABC transporter ATP-binding protein [Alphaproteobacteria bacterium]
MSIHRSLSLVASAPDVVEAPRAELLRMRAIIKSFAGVQALKSVDFTACAGEVHAIVGENGAGKSTLMAIAAGDLEPDAGTVELCGRSVSTFSAALVSRLGLALVHQHPALLNDLTIAENFLLALPKTVRPSRGQADSWTRERLREWAPNLTPSTYVSDLPMADQHLVGLSKALATDPSVLILDEPTEHMDTKQVQQLFAGIRSLAAQGRAIIYISHRIHEVKSIADRITVLRDGTVCGIFDAKSVSEAEIINLVVGRTLNSAFPAKPRLGAPVGEPLLQIRDLSGPGFTAVSLNVCKGEIIGLAGIEGNGQREFLRGLAGLLPTTGSVAELSRQEHPTRAAAYIPRDRHREGLMMSLSVGKNAGLMSLAQHALCGFVSP